MGPLDGIRIIDLTRILAGPFTMNLGDMGAEIIKVEQPGRGDDTRSWVRRSPMIRPLIFLASIVTNRA